MKKKKSPAQDATTLYVKQISYTNMERMGRNYLQIGFYTEVMEMDINI